MIYIMKFIKLIVLFIIVTTVNFAIAGTTTATINILGRITAPPCTVDTDTINQTVFLGKTFVNELAAGSGSVWTPFTLTLSKCPVNWENATVTLTGNSASDNKYFANSGSAQGVVLQISDTGHTKSYGNGATITELIDVNRNVTFQLDARMFNPSGVVTAGDFNAVVEVDFTYQ
ncbi:type 1 fimbrial protein [Enterobacter asburiae]|nr:fimbrial protein [Enterobacter asburiae]KAA0531050.1 fimbrial protein [Enterobacter dykesii]RTN76490.1 type 1 fimbrial protein [Enterobacter asburiae]RTP74939.1 type 1 fimbrial protein [Enterobacter asburiae]